MSWCSTCTVRDRGTRQRTSKKLKHHREPPGRETRGGPEPLPPRARRRATPVARSRPRSAACPEPAGRPGPSGRSAVLGDGEVWVSPGVGGGDEAAGARVAVGVAVGPTSTGSVHHRAPGLPAGPGSRHVLAGAGIASVPTPRTGPPLPRLLPRAIAVSFRRCSARSPEVCSDCPASRSSCGTRSSLSSAPG